jgi:uncharacterized protein (TIGR02246 family)
MHYRAILAGLAAAALAVAAETRGQETGVVNRPVRAGETAAAGSMALVRQREEPAIRLLVNAFAKAYNAGDSKALALLFTPEAEIVSENGTSAQGRDAIGQVFAQSFKEHPKTRMAIAIESIRLVSPGLAIEHGTSTVTHAPGEPAERSRYVVVHVKRDGQWRMAAARDISGEPLPAEEQLKQLAGLIGDWIDESPDAAVVTSYRWTDNHCYILGEFTVQVRGRPAMTGSQRIGWDPLAKKIRSWVFDSEGGFAEGVWTRQGNQWITKMTGVTRDGKAASSTNIITWVAKDRLTWQSRDRIVGDEKTPDVEQIPIVRRPPLPK